MLPILVGAIPVQANQLSGNQLELETASYHGPDIKLVDKNEKPFSKKLTFILESWNKKQKMEVESDETGSLKNAFYNFKGKDGQIERGVHVSLKEGQGYKITSFKYQCGSGLEIKEYVDKSWINDNTPNGILVNEGNINYVLKHLIIEEDVSNKTDSDLNIDTNKPIYNYILQFSSQGEDIENGKSTHEIREVIFFVTENNLPASQDLTFNFKDLNTNDEQKVTSSNTMITIKLTDGHKYKVSLVSDEKSMKDIEFVVTENGPKIVGTENILEMLDVKPVKNENIPQGDLSFDKLTVRVLKDSKALNDYNMVLNFFDNSIPTIILKPKTDENGEIELKDFKANSKYEIRTGRNDEVLKFKKDAFTFQTDKDGRVIIIDGKPVNDESQATIIFEGTDLNNNIFEKFDVDFKAVDAEGNPMKDVEFSIMMLAPRFTTVQKVKSDVNGNVKFNVEGQKDGKGYSVTLSKMDKFKFSSKPYSMEFKLDDKGNIVMNELDKKYNRTFVVSKEDRTYIYKEFKDLYEKAKEYLKNQKFIDSKEAKEAIKNLENVIKASEREIIETLPIYAQGKIDQLKKAMEDLKAFEKNQVQPEKPHLEESRVERLHGQDRYLTSVEVSKKNFTEAKVVLLANGIKEADALTAAPLADKNKAPILLVNKDEIKEEVLGEIKRLKAEKVIILGGKEAISDQVVEQIEGVEVERIEGKDRFETSVKIAEKLGNTNKLILANGNDPVDALASSALAIKEGRAILYVEKDQIPEAAKEMGKQAEDILIVGGENAVNKEVEESLQGKTVERLEGKDRFQTATKIAERIKLEAKIVAVASGRSYVDALAYGPVTGKLEATIVLTEEKELPEATRVYLEKTKPSKIYLVGGENRIAEGLVK